jgi:deoxycytidylate deaminase
MLTQQSQLITYFNIQSKPKMSSNLTNKDRGHIARAKHEALKSLMLMRHGCVVANGNKIVATGYNSYRTRFGDNFINESCSCHAEMDALRKVIRYRTKGCSSKNHHMVVQRSPKVTTGPTR